MTGSILRSFPTSIFLQPYPVILILIKLPFGLLFVWLFAEMANDCMVGSNIKLDRSKNQFCSSRASFPQRLCHLCPWGFPKCTWTKPWANWSEPVVGIVLSRRLIYTLGYIPTWIILWFVVYKRSAGQLLSFRLTGKSALIFLVPIFCKSCSFTQYSIGSTALLLSVKQDWEPSVWEIKFSLLLYLMNDNKKWLHVSLAVSSQGILKQAHLSSFFSVVSDFILVFAHTIKQMPW